MGKPYWGINNHVTRDDTTISARTENVAFPASNLRNNHLWPGWRSSSLVVKLNGSSEHAYVDDHSDFDIAGDLTIPFLIRPARVIGQQFIVNKLNAGAGYALCMVGDELRMYIGGTSNYETTYSLNMVVGTWYRGNAIYDSSSQTITINVNNTTVATTTTGTIPGAIATNATRVTLGADSSGSNLYQGRIDFVGIMADKSNINAYPNPLDNSMKAYWSMDGGLDSETTEIPDDSENSHNLTVVGIDASNFIGSTAYQWLGFDFASDPDPTYVFVDRRHNLSSNAKITLFATNWYTGAPVISSVNVVESEPIVMSFGDPGGTQFKYWLEINDPGNRNGYLEIPYIFVGSKTMMQRSFLRGYGHSDLTLRTVLQDSGGGFTGYVQSDKLWQADLKFRASEGDFTTLRSVVEYARNVRPVVFCEDESSDGTKTRLVYLTNAGRPGYGNIVQTNHFVDLSLQETG